MSRRGKPYDEPDSFFRFSLVLLKNNTVKVGNSFLAKFTCMPITNFIVPVPEYALKYDNSLIPDILQRFNLA